MFVTYLPAYFFLGEGDFALIQQLREQRLFWSSTHYILRAREKAEDEKKRHPRSREGGGVFAVNRHRLRDGGRAQELAACCLLPSRLGNSRRKGQRERERD